MLPQYERYLKLLWALVMLALAAGYWLYFRPMLTSTRLLDGSIGVILGLYICSHPAANAVDMLFFERRMSRRVASKWFDIGWLGLNLLVLLLGLIVIVSGAIRFVG